MAKKAKKAAKKKGGRKVHVGIHGLAKVLATIRRKPDLRQAFEKHMGGSATVALDAAMANKIKTFAADNLSKPHHIPDDCDCDPTTDPFCICF